MRRQKRDEELAGCTFQPQIASTSPFQVDYDQMEYYEDNMHAGYGASPDRQDYRSYGQHLSGQMIHQPGDHSFSEQSIKQSEQESILQNHYDRYDEY